MSHQMVGLSIQSPLSTISVLVLHLLLVSFAGGQSQLTGSSQPIVATISDDIILPCQLEPAEDVTAYTLEWTRSNLDPRFVHVQRGGRELADMKNPLFSGRTSLFTDELKHGNISLKLSRVKPADEGRYRCFILNKGTQSFVELLVGAASSPVISLAGTDRDKGSVDLTCESKGWYPEPELLWLDAEGEQLSAGPTQTVRGPDDLYTVSSRVTVEKRHSNSFTCRVQQKTIHQSRDTQIHVPDDFFKLQSSSAPVIIALAVTLAVSIIISLVFYVWKRQNLKTKRRQRDEEEREREQLMTEEKMELEKQLQQKQDELKELQEEKKKQEDELQSLMKDLETKDKQLEQKQDELKELQGEKEKQEDELQSRIKQLETKITQLEKQPG